MAEALLDPGQIHIASHEVGRQRVLESVRVVFLGRKAGGFRTVPKDAKELRAVKPSALLRCEEVIRSIGVSIPEPGPERPLFIQQRLALVPVNRLDRVERAL